MFFGKKKNRQSYSHAEMERLHAHEYILSCESSARSGFEYVLYRPWGDGDPDYPLLSLAILRELLAPFQVITHVKTWNPRGDWSRDSSVLSQEEFPLRYEKYLRACGRGDSVCRQENEMFVLSAGLDCGLFGWLTDLAYKESWCNSICIYGYQKLPFEERHLTNFQRTLEEDTWDVLVRYEEQHDVLTISVKQGKVSQTEVEQLICRVCQGYGKQVMDPETFMRDGKGD